MRGGTKRSAPGVTRILRHILVEREAVQVAVIQRGVVRGAGNGAPVGELEQQLRRQHRDYKVHLDKEEGENCME